MAVACTSARVSYLSTYFDSLVDLVPSKHYLDPEEVLDLRSMKREERLQTKRAFKTQHKQAKRAKLDPDGESHTTAAQRRQEAQEERFKPSMEALVQSYDGAGGKPGVQILFTRCRREVYTVLPV
jgi:ribosomal protein S12 methylthiotransferase accessory factor YcaO